MKFRHLSFPSGLFIHSSSTLTRLSYGGTASSGKAFKVCSKISSSILSERESNNEHLKSYRWPTTRLLRQFKVFRMDFLKEAPVGLTKVRD